MRSFNVKKTSKASLTLFLVLCLVALSSCSAGVSNNAPIQENVRTQNSAQAADTGGTGAVETAGRAFTDDPEAMDAAAASVLKLDTYSKNGDRIATGSGFCAFDSSVLVTAAHVTANMAYMTATRDDGSTFRIDRLIDGSKDKDIALCALPDDAGLTPLAVSSEEALRGEKIAVIGSQFGVVNLVTLGNICARWESGGTHWLLFTAPVSGGSSGGPLINSKGLAVGIVSATYENGQNLNVAAPIAEAEKIYKSIR